ncbi:hypothetical protein L2E82_47538 [Cichorium intybus]|uniref:Uncharacterized protein n=1 Tax=Cichorium intybus TaxID=13427 RepID=A0ACB8YWB2_CICIN|nr:hypothetical protein L2E82_47538 [Cichorium intybus]
MEGSRTSSYQVDVEVTTNGHAVTNGWNGSILHETSTNGRKSTNIVYHKSFVEKIDLQELLQQKDCSVELTSEDVEFFRGVFSLFDIDGDDALNEHELEDLFSTAPENPWSEAPIVNAVEKNALGGLSVDGFLSQWALMILLNPMYGVENLIYIGYAEDPSSAIRITRKRRVDRNKKYSKRNVFQCFVFGPKEAGKTSLLNYFVGRLFIEAYKPTTEERFFSNSKESSWTRATELLIEVASHGESMGYEVPCLIVAEKDDIDPYPTAIQDSTRAFEAYVGPLLLKTAVVGVVSEWQISEAGEGALQYLKEDKWCRIDGVKSFELELFFDTNPCFKNYILTKTYEMINELT